MNYSFYDTHYLYVGKTNEELLMLKLSNIL